MCAEQIPLDAAVCEYCGTVLEEGKATKVQEEPIASSKLSAQEIPPSIPAQKQSNPWLGIAIGLGTIAILAVVGGGILIAQNGLPFLATPTNTPRPTAIPTRTPNLEATRRAQNTQAAATAQFAWVQYFAQPILDDVRDRKPNFEDDFSDMGGGFARWGKEQGVVFTGDVMRINTTGRDDVDVGGSINAHDFVLEYEFTPHIRIDGSCAYVNFRWGDTGGYSFNINLNDNWRGMITIPNEKSGSILMESWSEDTTPTQRTIVTIIAKGNQFALFINGKPLAYVSDSTFDGTWNGLGVWSPNGPAEVDFDNIKLWDLNNLNP